MTIRRARPPLKVTLSRERATSVVSPSEAGYIGAIKSQMDVILKNLERAIEHINFYTPEAVRFGLEPIYDESQILVPVDKGVLKASGFIETRSGTVHHTTVIGYGKYGNPHYAAMVHERLDLRHEAPTQAKYLEQAIATKGSMFAKRVTEYMSKLAPLETTSG